MRLLIVGTLSGQLTTATKLAMDKGATVTHATDIAQALAVLRSGRGADLLMVDVAIAIRELVSALEAEHIHAPIVACGTATDARAAVAAIQAGAKEYIPLPPDPELIAAVLAAVADDTRDLIYRDDAMARVVKLALQIAPSDASVLITSLIVIAVPIFVLGFLAQFVFGVRLGVASVTVGDQPTFARLLLPGVVLGSVSLAYVVRLTRSAVAANAHADYVRTATATGLSRPRVVTVHILRNSLIPVVTFLGADLGALMGGAIVTEGIFNIHGVGGVLYQAVTRQEAPTVVSIVTVLVVIYLATNLAVDLLYAALDPRIRYG